MKNQVNISSSKTNNKKIILPNFLGIGAMRSGTTWLDGVLRAHPDIYLPEKRKEVHFFDRYYDRGIEWYKEFFSFPEPTLKYQNIGEITPAYLYFSEVPIRIKEHIPDCRFIVILRNPADRAYSHYGFRVKNYAEQRTFQELLDLEPEIFLKGLYSQQLKRYLQHFPLENFLILIYEHALKNPEKVLNQLADFLSVDLNKFDLSIINQRANSSGSVRFSHARALACKFRNFLRSKDLDWVWNVTKISGQISGMEKIFEAKGKSFPPIDLSIKAELISKYESDIIFLEKLIGMDLSVWRKPSLSQK